MEYIKECPFCCNTRFKNNDLIDIPGNSSILFKNNNLYIQVDISPLCVGHILIITNEHYLNFFETSSEIKEDAKRVREKIIEVFREVYNSDVLFFEHGSSKSGAAGSSIDHAHIHAIPCDFDIEDEVTRKLGTPTQCDILKESDYNNEFSYIYIEKSNKGKIYKVDNLSSQFLREIVASKNNNSLYLWQDRCITDSSKKDFNQTIEDLHDKFI